jgi:hypothetical protein
VVVAVVLEEHLQAEEPPLVMEVVVQAVENMYASPSTETDLCRVAMC